MVHDYTYYHGDKRQFIQGNDFATGKGAFQELTDPSTGSKVYTPYAEFKVKPAMRYRFRVISAAIFNCPIQFSVDNHTLMMIASDGSNFDPIVVDSFNIFPGERFDFVLIAHDTLLPQNYWIRVRGLADCSVKKSHQVAVLRYEGAPPGLPASDTSYEAGERLGIVSRTKVFLCLFPDGLFHLPVRPSVCPSLSICLSVCLPACQPVRDQGVLKVGRSRVTEMDTS